MKHVIIIADGGADFGLSELGGRTPFEAARTPWLDRLACSGTVGTVVTTPAGGRFEAGSDVCSMSLLGYDPVRYHTGRAPLEAAALGLKPSPADWIFRLNFVTVGDEGTGDAGLMLDHSSGAISDAEARELGVGLVGYWRWAAPELAKDFVLTPGVSYRNILVDSGAGRGGRTYAGLKSEPPHELPRRRWGEHRPRVVGGEGSKELRAGAAAVNRLMDLAREYLPSHRVNLARVAAGKRPANMAWVWGQGVRPDMPLFMDKYGLRGAMITSVDLLAGIAALIGWERLSVPGLSSYHDNDYAGQGRAAAAAIDEYDVVCCHVESPDEASHQGDWKTKVATIEAIDGLVVGPVVEKLRAKYGEEWRVLVMPDHYTLCSTRKHDGTPPPYLICGKGVEGSGAKRFTEGDAARGPRVEPGDGLMEVFLGGGERDRRGGR